MKVSVVVGTRNRPETIGQALESIVECDYPDFDIHIMDQSTNDITKDIVAQIIDRCRHTSAIYYHHLDRVGHSAAYNTGISACDGEIIACTDDDVIVPVDWIEKIAAVFTREPDAGLLYGQVLIPKEMENEVASGMIIPALSFDKYERISQKEGFRLAGMGANMAIRRTLFERVGGFDEALGGGGPLCSSNDFDFCWRTLRFGGVVVMAPDVKVYHYGARTPDQWRQTMANYGIGDGGFYAKHIRSGDLKAFGMFAKRIVISRLREIRNFVRNRRWNDDPYGRHLMVGYRASKVFDIDARFLRYKETERGKMVATEANDLTVSRRN